MDLVKIFREIIVKNELGGNIKLAFRFSDPDGLRTGKSGWSFGICQFDLNNNSLAAVCLQECKFTPEEISALKRQDRSLDMGAMNAWLLRHADVVARWDEAQLAACLARAREMAQAGGWSYADDRALLYAGDYHNQMFMGKGGAFYDWARRLGRPLADYDIHKFRRNQAWGKRRPDDVDRRHGNVIAVAARYGL